MPPSEPINGRVDAADHGEYLSSWKEIAAELDISVKTAQRWETERNLPVKRIGSRVQITRVELDRWRHSSGSMRPWWDQARVLRWIAVVSTSVALVLSIWAGREIWRSSPGLPFAVRWVDQNLEGRDRFGRLRFAYRSEYPLWDVEANSPLRPALADLNNDQVPEALLVAYHEKRDSIGWDLVCLNADGVEQWRLRVTERVTAGKEVHAPPYVIRAYKTFDSPDRDGTKWVAAVFVHRYGSTSVLKVVDGNGQAKGTYWHAGHLNVLKIMDVDKDGTEEIVAGGIDHAVSQATVVAFDPRHVDGASWTPVGHELHYAGKPAGTEKYRVHFARSRINKAFDRFNFVTTFDDSGDGVGVSVCEHLGDPRGYVVYILDSSLRIQSVVVSSALISAANVRANASGGRIKPDALMVTPDEVERLKREFKLVRLR